LDGSSDYLAWLDSYNEPLRQRMSVIVGTSALEMSSTKVRSAEVPLGNYVTDILRDKLQADVAILPAAYFPGLLPEGPITLGDLYAALPYDQYGVVIELTGGELKEVLDEAANQIGKPGFPQVSGVSFGILGGEAYSVLVGGRELDLFANYRLATSDTMAEGNYGYAQLGTIARVDHSGLLIRDLVRERLAAGQEAQASVYQHPVSRLRFDVVRRHSAGREPRHRRPGNQHDAGPSVRAGAAGRVHSTGHHDSACVRAAATAG
jgi:2',3'-cyclic-nucleotide 2'-phosphodiesterase (5'-nucleotidase family)